MANEPFNATSDPSDLSSLVLRLSMTRGLDDVIALVRRGVRRLLGADGATFVLREGDCCFYVDEDAISPLWKGQRFPLDRCISGWVMRNGQPAAVPDIYKDPRVPADVYRLTFVRSLIMVPVGRLDAPAAIGAYWKKRRAFSEQQIALLTAIADAASVAMLNLTLYGALRATADEATRKAKEAERANSAKGLFLAAASHNLRQPFQAMRLYQEVLATQLNDTRAQATMAKLDQAMKAGEELLSSLLDISILDAGIVAPHAENFPVGGTFQELFAEYGPRARAAGHALRMVPCSAMVRSDPMLLRRVVGNLIENAIRFTPRGGRVLMGCRRMAEGVRIEVWDTGIGIAPDYQDAIFDEFVQIGNEGRNKENGLGLGLALVAKTCRLLGHRFGVQSQPGRGSVFWLVVPTALDPRQIVAWDACTGLASSVF